MRKLGKVARATQAMLDALSAFVEASKDVDSHFAAGLLTEQARTLTQTDTTGRPSTYDTSIAIKVVGHMRSGMSERKAAALVGIHSNTFNNWKKHHPELAKMCSALTRDPRGGARIKGAWTTGPTKPRTPTGEDGDQTEGD
jgi:hypothetical protein